MRVYGDLHGSLALLEEIARDNRGREVRLVGDIGFGFHGRLDSDMDALFAANPNIRYIRGNHDSPQIIREATGYIEDGTVEDGILYVGGAWSIDWSHRTPGYNWWPNEELSDTEWGKNIFPKLNDSIHTVISHDGPDAVTLQLLDGKPLYPTRTGRYLEYIRRKLPNLRRWVFGHYHLHRDITLEGCRFTALEHENIKGYVDL